uniref:Major facilitator superfamily (MFS) profile domain-containing protein n=1 Tax=Meloidogyne enterolobii TaxID=390850 RepID=A0A6V7UG80_MELEN|nr:unnamed protein product [Meloidogyne enterolobii]
MPSTIHQLPFSTPKIAPTQQTSLNTNKNDKRLYYTFNYVRFLILALSTICLSLTVGSSLAFNFTLICMEEDNTESVTSLPKIQKKREPLKEHLNSEDTKWQKDWLLSVVAVGTLLGTLPITWITEKLGIRWMVTVYGMLSSLATLLVPFASTLGFWTLLAVRVVQGFGVATSYVAMSTISEEWAPLSESGMFLCLISCHFQFGPLLVMPIAGELCESTFGWTAVYHIFGSVSIFFFILFCLFFRDSPNEHFLTTELERRLIGDGKKQIFEADKNSGNVPYLRMLTDIVVWGILISNFGATFGNQIFNQLGPQYLSKALGMHPKNAGFAAALPFLLAAAIKIMAGPISDKIGKRLSERTRVILFTSISQYFMALLFTALVLLPKDQTIAIQACYTAVAAFSGLWQIGAVKCAQLSIRQFSASIFSWNTFVSYAIVLVLPEVSSRLAPNKTAEEWNRIFIGIAVSQVICTTFFNFTARVEPRPWTMEEDISKERINKNNLNEIII